MSAINLTKGGFLRRVMDYEKNPISDWKFLGNKPAVIDFYASWCGPCRMLLPIIEELSDEYEEGYVISTNPSFCISNIPISFVEVYKVNVDEEEELANLFGVRSVPTLVFIPMGERPQMSQGALPKHKLKDIIDNVLVK